MSEHEPRTLLTETDQTAEILEIAPDQEPISDNPEATIAVAGLANSISDKRRGRYHSSQTEQAAGNEEQDEPSQESHQPTPPTRLSDYQGQRFINKENKANKLIKSDNHILEKIWGDDIGTDEFKDRIKYMRPSLRKHARKAHRKYSRNSDKAEKLRESLYPETTEEQTPPPREDTETRTRNSDEDQKFINLRTRVKNYINRKLKGTPEHEFLHPGYYFDTENIISLRSEINSTIERKVSLAVADAYDNGFDESSVDIPTIEHETTLEGVANYLGFRTWEEAEEKTPNWLIEPIVDLYGMSDEQLREYGITDPNKVSEPAELEHDDVVEISNDDDEIIEPPSQESNEELPKWNSVDLFIEMSRPENRDNGVYDRAIEYLAEEIEESIQTKSIDAKTPAEKHKIASEVYADQIASMLGVTENELNDPNIVPEELKDQILSDVTKTRKQLKQTNQPTPEATPEPEVSKPEAKKTADIYWDDVLNPRDVMNFRKQRDARVKKIKEKYLEDNEGARFTAGLRQAAVERVEAEMLPEYIGIDSIEDIDTTDEATQENMSELRDLIEMEWEDLKSLLKPEKRAETFREKRDRERKEAFKQKTRLSGYDQILES